MIKYVTIFFYNVFCDIFVKNVLSFFNFFCKNETLNVRENYSNIDHK